MKHCMQQQGSAILVALFLVVLVSATAVLLTAQANAMATHTKVLLRRDSMRDELSGAEAWARSELHQPISSAPKAWQVSSPMHGRIAARLLQTAPQFFLLCVDIEKHNVHQYWRTTLQRKVRSTEQVQTRVVQQQLDEEAICRAN